LTYDGNEVFLMPRPRKCRRICTEPEYVGFQPDGILSGESVTLTLDEYEVIRLVDHQKLTHEQCAKQMEVSRTTVTEIYERARFKLAECLVEGKRLIIAGGDYRVCDHTGHCCPTCTILPSAHTLPKEESLMRIAVTYENGNIFQHFGHTAHFAIYDVQDGKITAKVVLPTMGSGHGALAGFLKNAHVDALICGGIGGGAQMALQQAGIQLYGGVQGSADDAVNALIADQLNYNPDVHCDHHDHEHGDHDCGSHNCGDHGCGGSCHH